jgi:hypothetical protein
VDAYSVTILGNVEECRTEAEISRDGDKSPVAVVYEASDGWHKDVLNNHVDQADRDFKNAVDIATERLSHYVNRRGENAPDNATKGAFSLWLMVKDDGTAMGIDIKSVQGPD